MQRLAIIVPYRNREAHLRAFVPHVRAYFARDKLDRGIPYRALVIEQEGGLPFNRGALKNIGFALARDSADYVCFHDIDYLPIWADYSPVEVPTPIVWYGAEIRPIAPGRTQRVTRHELDTFFGGAVLVPIEEFVRVNGYSNDYWGWGFEDEDLQARFKAAGIGLGRRKGTFRALEHDSHGFNLDGTHSEIGLVNQRLFQSRWGPGGKPVEEGLSTLAYDVLWRKPIDDLTVERAAAWDIITVRLKGQPSPEQIEAHRPANVDRSVGRSARKGRRGPH